MPRRSSRNHGGWGNLKRDMLSLFLIGAVFRIGLLLAFPIPYGNDGFGRLYFRDHLFLSHWLPLTQAIVWFCSLFEEGIFGTRLVFALLGAASAAAFYAFLRTLVSRRAAFLGGLLFSFNVLYVIGSLMPYQDVFFLGLFYTAMTVFFRDSGGNRSRFGYLVFGLACLTRYEAWFTIPALAVWRLGSLRSASWPRLKDLLAAAALLGWGPLVWFVLSTARWGAWNDFLFQTPDSRFYGWHPHFDLLWVGGYALRMGYWAVLFASPLILLAIPAGWRLASRQVPAPSGLRVLLASGGLVLLFFFFIIGKEQETVYRFVGFPLSIALVLSVLEIEVVLGWLERRPWTSPGRLQAGLGTLLIGLLIYGGVAIYRLNQDPQYRVPYQVAGFLRDVLQAGESAVVVADRFRDLSDDSPLFYQRVATQAGAVRSRIFAAGNLSESTERELRVLARQRKVRYVVVFSGFEPWRPGDVFFAGETARASRATPLLETSIATVYHVQSW